MPKVNVIFTLCVLSELALASLVSSAHRDLRPRTKWCGLVAWRALRHGVRLIDSRRSTIEQKPRRYFRFRSIRSWRLNRNPFIPGHSLSNALYTHLPARRVLIVLFLFRGSKQT